MKEKCAYCGREIEQVNYMIHRDGFGLGPEVPLCDGCGAFPLPTLGEIWERIMQKQEDGE